MIVLFLVQLALADVPPVEITAEPGCDPISRETPDTECVKCTIYRGSRQQCEQYEAQRYTKVCEIPGTKVSLEVMCRDKRRPKTEAETEAEAPAESSGGWGCMHTAPAASLPFLLWALVPLRRRRRRRCSG